MQLPEPKSVEWRTVLSEDYFRSFVWVRWLQHLHDCWFIAPLGPTICTLSMCNGTRGTPQNICGLAPLKTLIWPCLQDVRRLIDETSRRVGLMISTD